MVYIDRQSRDWCSREFVFIKTRCFNKTVDFADLFLTSKSEGPTSGKNNIPIGKLNKQDKLHFPEKPF